MKLCMESVSDIKSQKPQRLTRWSLFLGILQTGMGLDRKKKFLQKYYYYILSESLLKAEQILIEEENGLKMVW